MKQKAKKKPIEVWATRYDDKTNAQELVQYMQGHTDEIIEFDEISKSIQIHKARGVIELRLGNWLLFEINTDQAFWAIDEVIFYKTYEKIKDGTIYIYRKKVFEVEYVHFKDTDKSSVVSLLRFMDIKPKSVLEYLQEDDWILDIQAQKFIVISTLEGREKLNVGEYLIKGVHGEFYPITTEAFSQIYEKI